LQKTGGKRELNPIYTAFQERFMDAVEREMNTPSVVTEKGETQYLLPV
jgi:hypothetical protein